MKKLIFMSLGLLLLSSMLIYPTLAENIGGGGSEENIITDTNDKETASIDEQTINPNTSSKITANARSEALVGDFFEANIYNNGVQNLPCSFKILSLSSNGKPGTVEIRSSVGGGGTAIDPNTSGAIDIPNEITYDGNIYKVTAIGYDAFTYCSKITTTGLAANSTVITIGEQSYSDCTSLQSTGLATNKSVTTVGMNAFYKCTSLKTTGLETNSTITTLSSGAFLGCSSLKSTGIETNSTITSIGKFAFRDCTNLDKNLVFQITVLPQMSTGVFMGSGINIYYPPNTANPGVLASVEASSVQEIVAISIKIKTPPIKTSYLEAEIFDPTGLVITGIFNYNTENEEEIAYNSTNASSFAFDKTELSFGDTEVRIGYSDKSVTLPITVKEKSVTSIVVKTAPTKVTYIEEEMFDPTGLVITATYDNGTSEDITYNEAEANISFTPMKVRLSNTSVTIKYGGKSTTQAIRVKEKTLTGIVLKTSSNKTTYVEGETFNPNGLVIQSIYDNGQQIDISYNDSTKNDFTFSSLQLGNPYVTITYKGKTTNQTIIVNSKSINSLVIKTKPKTNYIEGQAFDPTGLVITVIYNNGSDEDIAYNSSTASSFEFDKSEMKYGDKEVRISYGGEEVRFSITVAKKKLVSIEIKTNPFKKDYIEEESFNPIGLVISRIYDNGKSEDLVYTPIIKDSFIFDKEVLEKNDTKILITYENQSVELSVTVKEKSVASIVVKTVPLKVIYIEEEMFDPTGLVITATYDNGTSGDIAYNEAEANMSFTPMKVRLGNTSVTIKYGDKTTTQTILVKEKTLTGILLKTSSYKTSYVEGETFNPNGLVIQGIYDNGQQIDIAYSDSTRNDFTFSSLQLGNPYVTINYKGKTTNQTITVNSKTINSLVIKTKPKTSYIEGEAFDPTGLVISVSYNNGSDEAIMYNSTTASSFGFDKNELKYGDNEVRISYGGEETIVPITVVEKKLLSIEIKTNPFKMEYIEGEIFNPIGLVIIRNYDNGKSEDLVYTPIIKDSFIFDKEVLEKKDTKILITYENQSMELGITVTEKEINRIEVKTQPKTNYIEGQVFDPTGLVITSSYNNGNNENIVYDESTKNDFSFDKTNVSIDDTSVTITYNGKFITQAITVQKKSVTSIAVKMEPKTNYIEGQVFDPTGLVITATYDNGTSGDIAYNEAEANISFTPMKVRLGNTSVTIKYGGKSTTQTILVKEKTLTGIVLKTSSYKTSYVEGETFNPNGLVIQGIYDNGQQIDIAYSDSTRNDFTFSSLQLGNPYVTINYKGKTITQGITFNTKTIGAIAVKTEPKTNYIEGQTFDPTGLVISVSYNNGSDEDIAYNSTTATSFRFDKNELKYGDNEISISYGGEEASIQITVVKKKLLSIEIKTNPIKVEYIEGESFNPTGLVIIRNYDNGKSEDLVYTPIIKDSFIFDKEVLEKKDTKILITYENQSVELGVTVTEKVVNRIAVKTESKTNYIEGQTFDPTGLVITVSYNDGNNKDIVYNNSTASSFRFDKNELKYGDNEVRISYGGEEASIHITVVKKKVVSIKIKTKPIKLQYIETESFEPEGLVITVNYDNGKNEEIAYTDTTKHSFSFNKSKVELSDNEILISYEKQTVALAIKVKANIVEAIRIRKSPTKLVYTEGEVFDPEGLVIVAENSNGKKEDVSYDETTKEMFEFNRKPLTKNDKKVVIEYKEKEVEQSIFVQEKTVVKPDDTNTAPNGDDNNQGGSNEGNNGNTQEHGNEETITIQNSYSAKDKGVNTGDESNMEVLGLLLVLSIVAYIRLKKYKRDIVE